MESLHEREDVCNGAWAAARWLEDRDLAFELANAPEPTADQVIHDGSDPLWCGCERCVKFRTTRFAEVAMMHWLDFYRILFADPTFPPRTYEVAIASYLFTRAYGADVASLILDMLERHGSAECCDGLFASEDDREYCERLIPDSPTGNWNRPEYSGVWSLGGEET